MAMPRGTGKALALSTPIPTPDGWTSMGKIRVGDTVFDEFGSQCRVLYTSPIQFDRKCYRVDFSDGESLICDAEHLWQVNDQRSRRNPLILTTEAMKDRVLLTDKRGHNEFRYRIPLTRPIECEFTDLPIDPYILGYWLGDGTSSANAITIHKNDLAAFLEQAKLAGERTLEKMRKDSSATTAEPVK